MCDWLDGVNFNAIVTDQSALYEKFQLRELTQLYDSLRSLRSIMEKVITDMFQRVVLVVMLHSVLLFLICWAVGNAAEVNKLLVRSHDVSSSVDSTSDFGAGCTYKLFFV